MSRDERPFPPGKYDVVVVGSGPGGLQTSYSLRRLGVDHAVLSADAGPGGMFRRFPLFERLISWTHEIGDVQHSDSAFEMHDQNSLIADEPRLRALVAEHLTEGRRRPAREEMEAGLAAFAERAPVPVRYGCRWEATRRDDRAVVLVTSDGEYRCRVAVFAIGMTEPWVPASIPGLALEHHYVNLDGRRSYRGERVVIVGKRNSAFEVGESLLRRGVRQLTLVSPRPPDLGRLARSPLRPWYLTAYDEHTRGAPARFVLNASVAGVERSADGGYTVRAIEPGASEPLALDADVVVAATGFRAPLLDLPQLGVATSGDGRSPALTPLWESATIPGVCFAGNVTQAAAGLRKHGVASLSSMVCGFRYNARILARHIAERLSGIRLPRARLERSAAVPFLIEQLNTSGALAMQKGYLVHALSLGPDGAFLDEGVVPLEVFLDGSGDGIAAALEFDRDETIQPVLYRRSAQAVDEIALPPHPLRRYDGPEYVKAVEAAVVPFFSSARRA